MGNDQQQYIYICNIKSMVWMTGNKIWTCEKQWWNFYELISILVSSYAHMTWVIVVKWSMSFRCDVKYHICLSCSSWITNLNDTLIFLAWFHNHDMCTIHVHYSCAYKCTIHVHYSYVLFIFGNPNDFKLRKKRFTWQYLYCCSCYITQVYWKFIYF